jgi:hypothetical protein
MVEGTKNMIGTPLQLVKRAEEALAEGDCLQAIACVLLAIDDRLADAITVANDPYRGR